MGRKPSNIEKATVPQALRPTTITKVLSCRLYNETFDQIVSRVFDSYIKLSSNKRGNSDAKS